MHPTMRFIIGPVIHKQKFSSPVKLKVVPVKTNFKTMYRGPFDWTPLVTRLVQDEGRNDQIAKIADREAKKGNSVLILSRRIEHLERIAGKLSGGCEILTGVRKSADRKQILADFRDGKISILLATQLADEALDVPRLNRVVLTHPGKHEGRIIQQIGRALRSHPTKTDAVIYDLVDGRVAVLRRQWNQRKQTYKTARISVASTGTLLLRR
jgi:superfamily II DNA or RNA helicase